MVNLIAARDHNGYQYSGQKMKFVKMGDPFTVESEALADRLVEKGLAHRGEAASAPVKPVPVVERVSAAPKVDGRSKAGRKAAGR